MPCFQQSICSVMVLTSQPLLDTCRGSPGPHRSLFVSGWAAGSAISIEEVIAEAYPAFRLGPSVPGPDRLRRIFKY